MSGKKEYCVVNVTTCLTKAQASDLISAFSKAKNRVAPMSRSTAGITTKDGVGSLLQKGFKLLR